MKNEEKNKKVNMLSFDTMNGNEMSALLLELSKTNYWQAILRFNREKDGHAISSLISLDPFKDPTGIARTQGIRAGTYSMEQAVNELIKAREEGENAVNNK